MMSVIIRNITFQKMLQGLGLFIFLMLLLGTVVVQGGFLDTMRYQSKVVFYGDLIEVLKTISEHLQRIAEKPC